MLPSSSPIPRPPRPNRTVSGFNISSSQSTSYDSSGKPRSIHSPPNRSHSPAEYPYLSYPQRGEPIVAESLSSISSIAENPPVQFIPPPSGSPSYEQHGGSGGGGLESGSGNGGGGRGRYPKPVLVLYIVRVPGQQDIFLTTMHPMKSTVTAEDVMGCLYYVHVHDRDHGASGENSGVGGRPSLLGSGGNKFGRRRSAMDLAKDLARGRVGGGGSGGRYDKSTEFGMTIIRRDPASGEQWNVAEIVSGPGVGNAGESIAHLNPNMQMMVGGKPWHPPPPSMMIALLREGYRKFIPSWKGGSEKKGYDENLPPLPPLPPPPMPPIGNVTPEQEEEYFRQKRIYNERFAAREQLRRTEEERQQGIEQEQGLLREVFWDEAKEGDKWWKRKLKKTRDTLEGREKKERKKGDHWKGFTFDALWGLGQGMHSGIRGGKEGRCRFKEMAGGKILKCKYYPVGSGGEESCLVSALEFKLPPSATFHSHHRSRSTASDVGRGEEDGMGVGLGAEAGGYDSAGEKVKLGTFVVHNVGMEMLDLVVAANVGMFWRKWEGWLGERGAVGGAY